MTAPRQILASTSYLVTRRCAQRQFLLKPRPIVNETFLYLLAVAARRYGIEVHTYCVLSTTTTSSSRTVTDAFRLPSVPRRAARTSLQRVARPMEAFWPEQLQRRRARLAG